MLNPDAMDQEATWSKTNVVRGHHIYKGEGHLMIQNVSDRKIKRGGGKLQGWGHSDGTLR